RLGPGGGGGRLGRGPVAGPPARRAMHDLVVLRLHLADRHLPLLGGRRLEHHAGRGAAPAHGVEEMAGGPPAVGVLGAELLLVARRPRDAPPPPLGPPPLRAHPPHSRPGPPPPPPPPA